MTQEIKERLSEDQAVRWFLRGLTGIILVFYTGYIIWKKFTTDEVPLSTKDWSIIIGSIAIWATWEAARKFLNRKLGN